MVKTKTICTLGPASSTETVIRKMILAGMDVARLNFSHGKPQEWLHSIGLVQILNKKYHRRIKILGDIQGHRIRIGNLGLPINLKKRQTVWLTQEQIKSTNEKIHFDYRGPLNTIKKGHHIFVDDGNINLEVSDQTKNSLKLKVITGGLLKAHKGVNIPEAKLKFDGMTPKDIQDILFCEKNALEYIALSFVRTKSDILSLKNMLRQKSSCQIIAKIETRESIKNIDEIIKVSDGILIARGDMGISLPIYQIPMIQKMIIKKCNRAKKIVITATQMLESMIDNPLPTRAEVTDVANAIIDGTDFVMLSAESAVGKYPVETVKMMNNIIKFTEGHSRS